MPNYQILMESERGVCTCNVNNAEGIRHAMHLVREQFKFQEWRVINIAEHLEPLP